MIKFKTWLLHSNWIFLSVLMSWSATADQLPMSCSFKQDAKNDIIKFTTSMNIYGVFRTAGVISGKAFECTYKIRDFIYSPGAIVPRSEFLLALNQCSKLPPTVGRLRTSVTLSIERDGKRLSCKENLIVNYPSGEDKKPIFDAKEMRRLSEKYQRKVWP